MVEHVGAFLELGVGPPSSEHFLVAVGAARQRLIRHWAALCRPFYAILSHVMPRHEDFDFRWRRFGLD